MDNVPYSSLVEAHQDLLRRGYDKNYKILHGDTMEDGNGHKYSPSQLSIDEFYRFEGESDPADNTIIYAVSANDGTKGTIVDAYGAGGSMKVAQFILRVEAKMQNKLSRQYNWLKGYLLNKSRKEQKLLLGLAAGALVGAVIGLMLAPKSKKLGKGLESKLKDLADDYLSEGGKKLARTYKAAKKVSSLV